MKTTDKIICRELTFECAIGFHEYELGVRQKVAIDLEVEVPPPLRTKRDAVSAIPFDYFRVNSLLAGLFEKERFNLLETAAEEIARLVLSHFSIEAVTVTVTKFPLDMPNAKSVSYVCYRKRIA